MHQILITYDIASDKRRTKVCDILKDYGIHVQYSVFECELSNKHFEVLIKRIKKVIKASEDSVRIYYLSTTKTPNVIELGNEKNMKIGTGVIFIE